jgi:general secretion pathway protein J
VAQHQRLQRDRRRAARGFTIVEILLAVTLLSIIVTVMYGTFHTMGRIMRRNERTKGAYQVARLIMSRVRQDLSCAYYSPTTANFVFRGEDRAGFDGNADALTFVTAGHVVSGRDVPEGDFAEVSYYLDDNNPGILVRREDLSPDDELEMGGQLQILGRNVLSLNFRYLDGTEAQDELSAEDALLAAATAEERDAWKDEWDSDDTTYPPRSVKIDLSVMNEEGQVEDFSTTVMLAMGRTTTSGVPAAPPQPGAQQRTGPPNRRPGGDRPQSGRQGTRPPRGDRGPDGERPQFNGPGGGRGTRSGTPTMPRGGSNTPPIRRNSPNAGTGSGPPMPGRGR